MVNEPVPLGPTRLMTLEGLVRKLSTVMELPPAESELEFGSVML